MEPSSSSSSPPSPPLCCGPPAGARLLLRKHRGETHHHHSVSDGHMMTIMTSRLMQLIDFMSPVLKEVFFLITLKPFSIHTQPNATLSHCHTIHAVDNFHEVDFGSLIQINVTKICSDDC